MSPIPISRRAQQTPPSPIRKLVQFANQAKKEGTGVLHLNIGQPDIATPPEFFTGLSKYEERVVAYEASEGNAELRTVWAEFFNASTGLNIDPRQMLITTGASEALVFTFMTCCDPGDEILIFDPTYANYIGFAAVSGVNLVSMKTSLDEDFALPDTEAIHSRITPRTKAILLCSPNNPTGTVYARQELERLIAICNERNIFLVVDETYREFVYDGAKPISVLEIEPDNQRLVVIDSLSKRFSLCGARLGCIVTPNDEIRLQALSQAQARLASPSIEQYAAAYMLQNLPPQYVQEVVSEYSHRRDVLFQGLSSIPDVVVAKPQGAFYMIARLPVRDAAAFAKFLLTDFSLNKQTVFVAPANGFYMSYNGGENKVRVACVLETSLLEQAVEILEAGLKAFMSSFPEAKTIS